MPLFSHTESGQTVDVLFARDVAEYQHILGTHGDWNIVEVPEGTVGGATPDGNGGWINPTPAPIVAPVPAPKYLSGSEFHAYCAAQLAAVNKTSPLAGLARMGDIIGAAEAATGGLMKIAVKRYESASVPGGKFNLPEVEIFLQVLVATNAAKQDEADAIIQNWPST